MITSTGSLPVNKKLAFISNWDIIQVIIDNSWQWRKIILKNWKYLLNTKLFNFYL